jgi:hypothetical protein
MKKIKLFSLICIMVSLCTVATAQTSIEIKSGVLKINKKTIQYPWTTAAFTETTTLGPAERTDMGGTNDIFTFDTKGIMLYQTPNMGIISAMNIYYGADENNDYDFIPNGLYSGSFKVDGFLIRGNTSLATVKTKLPQYGFAKSVIGAYRGEYKNLYIYLQYDPGETNILWVSVGKNK